ncbi:hypothetical protein RQP46_005751 [Phenoliferia psychrophenolica]
MSSPPDTATRFVFLPHDILSEIFSTISSSYDWLKPAPGRNAALSTLVLVSKDWHAAGTPILYRDLSLIWREQPVEYLLRTLIANPSLAALPRRLSAALPPDRTPLITEECKRLLSTPYGEERKRKEREKLCYLPEEELEELRREVENRMDLDNYYSYVSPHSWNSDNELRKELDHTSPSYTDFDSWSDSAFSRSFPEEDEPWPEDDTEGGLDSEEASFRIARFHQAYDVVAAQRETARDAFEEAKLARQVVRREANIQKAVAAVVTRNLFTILDDDTGFALLWADNGGAEHALLRVIAKLSSLRDLAITDFGVMYDDALDSIPPDNYIQNPADVGAFVPPEMPIERAPAEDGVGWHDDLERVLGAVQSLFVYDVEPLGQFLERMPSLESLNARGRGHGVAVLRTLPALPALRRLRLLSAFGEKNLWSEGWRDMGGEADAESETALLVMALEMGVDATVRFRSHFS